MPALSPEDMVKDTMVDCKCQGKKRQLRVAQMNLMLFDAAGKKPISSCASPQPNRSRAPPALSAARARLAGLYEKVEDWEYSPKLEQLSINVRVADDVVDKIELKMAKEQGEAALAAINENIKDLVAARKRAKREAKRQAKEQQAEREARGESPEEAAAPAPAPAVVVPQDTMIDCKHQGKKRKLRVAQMNIMLFDDAGTRPIDSWLYEKVEGWDYKDVRCPRLQPAADSQSTSSICSGRALSCGGCACGRGICGSRLRSQTVRWS